MKVFNTLTGKKEDLKPLEGNKVKMYVCGVTVYDNCHIGHARSQVAFDTISRYLRFKGYEVIYVRNFTDIDDKIINRAREEGVSWKEIAERYIESFWEDMEKLRVMKPEYNPRATDHIKEMLAIIRDLLEKGHAYVGSDGVYFSVRTFKEYGKLSKRNPEEMLAGARVEPGEGKREPLDFALWKFSKGDEPWWESPWGRGRPGWHIECSAMSMKYLGPQLDIHGGGADLIFPHHENEIAQSESHTGKIPFARFWIHNGFLLVRGEKMSKSLGNFYTVKDILKEYPPEVLRLFLLTKHYRSPLDFSPEGLNECLSALEGFYFSLYMMRKRYGLIREDSGDVNLPSSKYEKIFKLKEKFIEFMDDDFNTPGAVAAIFEALNELNKHFLTKKAGDEGKKVLSFFLREMKSISGVLGVFGSDPEEFLMEIRRRKCEKINFSPEKIEALIKERDRERRLKNFERADKIRKELKDLGIILEDYPEGTEWRVEF